MNIALELHARGTILPVRAQPGARRNGIRGLQDGALKVSVTQVAEKGKANAALVKVLAKELGLRKSQIHLLTGETSSQKRFLIELPPEMMELSARIVELLKVLDGSEDPS
jgi:uncharacterized protein (TIGR00251 family)